MPGRSCRRRAPIHNEYAWSGAKPPIGPITNWSSSDTITYTGVGTLLVCREPDARENRMALRRVIIGFAALTTAMLVVSCGASGGDKAGSGEVKGDITFLTNRTDLKTDGTWDKYIAEFQKIHPGVNIKVEAITDYEGDLKTRLSTPNGYGDVLMFPASLTPDQYADFLEPLGKTKERASSYRFLDIRSFEGVQYGIALGGAAQGVLYNTEVFKKAGVTTPPKTPQEFVVALKLVKEKTSAIPLYTNYKDGWPLGSWGGYLVAVSGDPDIQNKMAHDKSPWKEGSAIYVIDSLLYDAVRSGLTEPDPLTTNWEQSKGDLVTGKIATMMLGSWAITQFQGAAKAAGVSPTVVGFMPYPATVKGKQYLPKGGDYNLSINKNSSNKATARAWMDWLLHKSGIVEAQGMVSAILDAPLPANLSALQGNGIELLELGAAPVGDEALFNNIAAKSQVDLLGPIYRQKLVDIARGQSSGDMTSYFKQLNSSWGATVSELAK